MRHCSKVFCVRSLKVAPPINTQRRLRAAGRTNETHFGKIYARNANGASNHSRVHSNEMSDSFRKERYQGTLMRNDRLGSHYSFRVFRGSCVNMRAALFYRVFSGEA